MNVTHVVGVDPGLVHTGVVRLVFDRIHHEVHVEHEAFAGADVADPQNWIICSNWGPPYDIFIEAYRPRSHYGTDERMVKAVMDFKRALGGTVLQNTGVKKVVRQPLMELLGCWKFSTVTHHQDLRSAARIAILGMLKVDELNKMLAGVALDHLTGRSWHVHH